MELDCNICLWDVGWSWYCNKLYLLTMGRYEEIKPEEVDAYIVQGA
jgi:hypothetical protein